MSNCIVLCGFSNSGKSTSMKYLNPEETFIVSCTNKQLQIPGFRSKYKKVEVVNGELTGNWLVSSDYTKIGKILNAVSKLRPDIKVLVIDDINYLLSAQTFADANTKGYEKFTILAKNYYDLISTCQNLRDDLTVVIISHIENAGILVVRHTNTFLSHALRIDRVGEEHPVHSIRQCRHYHQWHDE